MFCSTMLKKKCSCRSGGKNGDDETADRVLAVAHPVLEVKEWPLRLACFLAAVCGIDYAGTASCKLLVSSLTMK